MGRLPNTRSTGKAAKPGGKKQFNAALPEQLVLDFNAAATEQGRDALLEDLILRFLERVRPDSPSVFQFHGKVDVKVELKPEAAAEIDDIIHERRALRVVRSRAEEVIAVTVAALTRKPPMKSSVHAKGERKRQAS